MLKRLFCCSIAVFLFAGLAYAGDPIAGTVTAVTSDTFTVKDKDKPPVVLMLIKGTKYVKDDKPAKKADLKVGVHVVIDAAMDPKMNMYNAEAIKISAAEAAKPVAPATKKN